ncbi:hypothetical protein ACFL1X_14255, partial [Candidatus Hydrogenedentota bacterium]
GSGELDAQITWSRAETEDGVFVMGFRLLEEKGDCTKRAKRDGTVPFFRDFEERKAGTVQSRSVHPVQSPFSLHPVRSKSDVFVKWLYAVASGMFLALALSVIFSLL